MSNNHAHTVMAQFKIPKVPSGVTLEMNVVDVDPLAVTLIGIRIPHPITVMTKNMFLIIRSTLKKTVASKPIRVTRSCSCILSTGAIQASGPLPMGGGACLSSAILSFGEYTREL